MGIRKKHPKKFCVARYRHYSNEVTTNYNNTYLRSCMTDIYTHVAKLQCWYSLAEPLIALIVAVTGKMWLLDKTHT